MVSGGFSDFNFPPISSDVSLLALDGDPSVPECLQNLNPLPKGFYGSCHATLTDGIFDLNTILMISFQTYLNYFFFNKILNIISMISFQTGKLPHICGGIGLEFTCDPDYPDQCYPEDDFECPYQGCNKECYRYNPGEDQMYINVSNKITRLSTDDDTWTVSGQTLDYTDQYTACAVNSVPEIIMNGLYDYPDSTLFTGKVSS